MSISCLITNTCVYTDDGRIVGMIKEMIVGIKVDLLLKQ